jgi:hypothetical protein
MRARLRADGAAPAAITAATADLLDRWLPDPLTAPGASREG